MNRPPSLHRLVLIWQAETGRRDYARSDAFLRWMRRHRRAVCKVTTKPAPSWCERSQPREAE